MTFQFTPDQINSIKAAIADGPNSNNNYSGLYQAILNAIADPNDPSQPLSTLTADERNVLPGPRATI